MKFQTYKYFNKEWLPITIQNVKKNDIIKYQNTETKEFLHNNDNPEEGFVRICIKDAYFNNKDKSWNIESNSFENELITMCQKVMAKNCDKNINILGTKNTLSKLFTLEPSTMKKQDMNRKGMVCNFKGFLYYEITEIISSNDVLYITPETKIENITNSEYEIFKI